jgi:16S rRNA A1518/A1519 N6-dimethyltransferase RsmA/KsgA/DIM1 with predicted DNA glycosylase/AP lyase activity
MPHRWCNSAKIRREQIESGIDLTFNEVFKPLIVSRIQCLSPSNILEVGAGTGHISIELFKLGFSVTAIEPSLGMYEVAQDVLSFTDVRLVNCTLFFPFLTLVFIMNIRNFLATNIIIWCR